MAGKRIVVFGWASKVQVHLSRWIYGLSGRGYDVKVIALGGEPLDGVETCNLPRKGKWSYLTQASTAVREAKRFRPHLVHAHYATGFGYWAYRTNLQPRVVSVWGADVFDFPTTRLRRALVRKVLKRATHITATSQLLRRKTLEILPGAQDKITVIPFGVLVADKLIPPPLSDPVRLCYIKNHNWKYGPDVLLKAMVEVRKVIPDIKLSMAGTGELNEFLKSMAAQLNLSDTVDFVGFVPHERMYSFIGQHHLMVMPSVMDSESFGVAALEASACGRPVIASNVGGVPEVVVNGKTGILVPPNDPHKLAEAIIRLAQDAETREKMGKTGYEFVKQHYSWERSLDMMCDLYERLINENQSR